MKTEIYEDNAGGLRCLYDGKVYFMGFDPAPGQLINDIISIDNWTEDVEPEDAEINENDKLIAEFDGQKITIHFDALGNSGKQYAGIED